MTIKIVGMAVLLLTIAHSFIDYTGFNEPKFAFEDRR